MLRHAINIGNGINKWGNGINLSEYTVCECIYSSNITFFCMKRYKIASQHIGVSSVTFVTFYFPPEKNIRVV